METLSDAGEAFSVTGEQATEVETAEVEYDTTSYDDSAATSDGTSESTYFDWDTYASLTAKVTVDGEEVEVPVSELRNGYMRHADYTRKTQEAARVRQEAADAMSILQALQADPQGFLQNLSQALGAQAPGGGDTPDDEYLDPTEREIRELKNQLDTLQKFERQRIFDAEVSKLQTKYGEDVDINSVVNHFVNHGFPTLEAAYKDLAYDQELERLKALEDKAKRDAEALEKKRKAAAVSSTGSKASGAVGTDPTQVRGIRAQFELAKRMLGAE
jgi:hypothetical protein